MKKSLFRRSKQNERDNGKPNSRSHSIFNDIAKYYALLVYSFMSPALNNTKHKNLLTFGCLPLLYPGVIIYPWLYLP